MALSNIAVLALLLAQTPQLVADSRVGMGTRHQILVFTSNEVEARIAMKECFGELTRLEQALSEWIPTSEVSRINRAAGGTAVKVGPDTLAVLTAGKEAAAATGGAFAMTWLALGALWKIPAPEGETFRVPAKADVERLLPLIGDAQIEIDATAGTVRLPQAGMAIGIGAIAKGYAMDRIADLLVAKGFKDVLVSAGGDVVARGSKGSKPWVVGLQIRAPRVTSRSSTCATRPFPRRVITSATPRWSGVRYHHILDPRTGFPARGARSVAVIADRGTVADAFDTGIFVMGPEAGMKLVEDEPRLEAVIIDDKNTVTISRGLAKTLRILRQPTP